MTNKDKLPKLVGVYQPCSMLPKKQIPLFLDMLVMDLKNSGIVCDNPLLRSKELEEFTSKWNTLTDEELKNALNVSIFQVLHVLKQNVPCVGCRRSAESLYFQLHRTGHPALYPLEIQRNCKIIIFEEKQTPQVVGTIFHNHAARLAKLIDNQSKRSKKSVRCLLHSLDSQKCRPLTPVWREVWDCMNLECKKDVCIIKPISLLSTLETYLRKHRFCGECRTKVRKAYSLLMDNPEPTKEKGYVSSLYSGIKRCMTEKHIHLQTNTDYITNLINRAKPELLGNRRERHAKTLEIAQEEVLTCLGICMYERLHRIYMQMREEEFICQVFAAVAIDTMSRNFETDVERARGISKLDLLYAEFAREEQQKQVRKEQKKMKRKRKKGIKLAGEENKDKHEETGDETVVEPEVPVTCSDCEELSLRVEQQRYPPERRHSDGGAAEEEVKLKKRGAGGKNNGSNKCKSVDYLAPEDVFKEGCAGSTSDHSQHDCGYSSETNNRCCETGSLTSSLSSSPDGSELACSEERCCQSNKDCITHYRLQYGGNVHQPSLQEMLEDDDDDSIDYYIPPEEVKAFKNNSREVSEKRQVLRETLQKRFAEFCVKGPMQVPRLLIQTKYASN